jgi:hypothetical protein
MLYEKGNYNITLSNKEELTSEKIKPTIEGKIEDKNLTLSEVKAHFLSFKENYKSLYKGSSNEFCLLANGFLQAEGHIGGIFRSGLNFYPICTATQLFSE